MVKTMALHSMDYWAREVAVKDSVDEDNVEYEANKE